MEESTSIRVILKSSAKIHKDENDLTSRSGAGGDGVECPFWQGHWFGGGGGSGSGAGHIAEGGTGGGGGCAGEGCWGASGAGGSGAVILRVPKPVGIFIFLTENESGKRPLRSGALVARSVWWR